MEGENGDAGKHNKAVWVEGTVVDPRHRATEVETLP